MKSLNEYLYESYMYNDGLITEALKNDTLRDFVKWINDISSEAKTKLNKMCKDINRIDPNKKVIGDFYRDMLNDIISSNGYKLNLGDINTSIAFSEIDNEDMKILNGKTSKQMEIRKALKEAISYDSNHIQYEYGGKPTRATGASGNSSIVIVKDTSTGDYKYILMYNKGKMRVFRDRRDSEIYFWDLELWKDVLDSIPENIEDQFDDRRNKEYTFYDILRNAQRADINGINNVAGILSTSKALKYATADMSNREYIIITTNKIRDTKAIQRFDARLGMIKNTVEQNSRLALKNRRRWKDTINILRAKKASKELIDDVSSAEPLFKRYTDAFSKFNGTDITNASENRSKILELMDSFVSLNNAIEFIKGIVESVEDDNRRMSTDDYDNQIKVAKSRFNKCKKEVEDLLDELS